MRPFSWAMPTPIPAAVSRPVPIMISPSAPAAALQMSDANHGPATGTHAQDDIAAAVVFRANGVGPAVPPDNLNIVEAFAPQNPSDLAGGKIVVSLRGEL